MGISCLGWFNYFYLGYLLGNNIVDIKISTKKLLMLWICSILLQIIEGYWYLSIGEINCGTQLKLSSLLTGSLFAMMGYKFVYSGRQFNMKFLRLLGDCSFGVYFSHMAVMGVLGKIPYYSKYLSYPIKAVFAVLISMACVLIGKKILGKYGKYLALMGNSG